MGKRSFHRLSGGKGERSCERGASTSEFLVGVAVVVLLAVGFHPAMSAIADQTSDTLIVAGGGSATSNQTGGGVIFGGGTVDCNQPAHDGYAKSGCPCKLSDEGPEGLFLCRPPEEE